MFHFRMDRLRRNIVLNRAHQEEMMALVETYMTDGSINREQTSGLRGGIGEDIGMSLKLKMILMIASQVESIVFLLVGNAQEKIGTIKGGHITQNGVPKGANSKGDRTSLRDHKARTILLYPA